MISTPINPTAVASQRRRPTLSLRKTIDKFTRRFSHVEKRVTDVHGGWGEPGGKTLPLATLDAFWDEAKAGERSERSKTGPNGM